MNTTPFGSWRSPITAELVTQSAPSLDQPQFDGDTLYWLQSRPWESGRTVIMRRLADGTVEDMLPAPLSARTRIHEYGGAPYLVADNWLYFCLDSDQRVYRLDTTTAGASPEVLTPDNHWRYADFAFDAAAGRLLACCERPLAGQQHPENVIVAIELDGSQRVTTLVAGADFYSNARISPCGRQISWLSWNHPNMPWDETELWLAPLQSDGLPGSHEQVAGGQSLGWPESVFQPSWHDNGDLYFVSDRTNWWQLYRRRAVDGGVEALCRGGGFDECELARPQWQFGMSTYGFLNDDTVLCCYTHSGRWSLATVAIDSGEFQPVASSYSVFSGLSCVRGRGCVVAAAATIAAEVVVLEETDRQCAVVYRSGDLPVSPDYLSQPEAISFDSGQAIAHAFLYLPCNADCQGPAVDRPPLVVMCHGGPTAACDSSLNLKIQYWTSRGFAVVDVNYRGSTGYGRQYRDALKGQWGVVDVLDAVNAANYLAEQDLVSAQHMAIRGGSAGGFTVLSALTFHDCFKAGASLYGIGDLEMLAAATHKFEAHYTDSLVGPYPQEKALYRQRSPINHVQGLTCPVIFLQGLEDKVVPPEQAESMVEALREKNIAVAYIAFKGEGHGFRRAENIRAALEAELYFYSRVFDFELAEPIPAIAIENMPPH